MKSEKVSDGAMGDGGWELEICNLIFYLSNSGASDS